MSPKASTRLLATQSDARLAALARAGHDRAFEALVQRYRPPLLRYCRRMSMADNRAEDVVQQALLRAWTALRRGAEVRELRPWLYRIAHNTAVDVARDAARDGSYLALELEGSPSGEPGWGVAVEPDLAGGLELREALSGMTALPEMQREVIFRTAVAGYSHEEVATALGISDGAVRGLLYRARATLRGAITAVTPPPLLAWIIGAGQSGGAERVSEVAAGGSIGLGGLLVKGGVAAITAGTLITGAVVVHDHGHSSVHRGASGADISGSGREVAAVGGSGRGLGSGGTRVSGQGDASGVARRAGAAGAVRLRVSTGAPGAHGVPGRAPGVSPSGETPKGTTYTIHVPAGGGAPGSGSAPSAPSGSSGGSSGGVGGSAPGGSAGGGSGGGSSGGGSAGGGSQESPPPAGGGSAGGGGGSGGSGSGGSGGGAGESGGGAGGGSGSEAESPPPGGSPPAGGSESGGSGPVGTLVHEVTGLLNGTVHHLLGH